MKRTTLFLLVVGLELGAVAQPNLDSLYAVWKDPQRPDSVRAIAYKNYIADGYLYSKPDSAYLLAGTLIAFAEAHALSGLEAEAHRLQGVALIIQNRYVEAIACLEKCFTVSEKSGNKKGMAAAVSNIGIIHFQQGNYPKALENYQRGLALNEEIGNKAGMSTILGNIAGIYVRQGEYAKALEHLHRSLLLSEQAGDKRTAAIMLMNMGKTYVSTRDTSKALDHFQQSLVIFEELDDKLNIALVLSSIGSFYSEQANYRKALAYQMRGLALNAELGAKNHMAGSLYSIGEIHRKQGEYHQSLNHCDRALSLAREINGLVEQRSACRCLYDTYKAMGRGNDALRFLEQIRVIDDSLQASETTKKLEQMEFSRQLFADSVAKAEEARVIETAHQEVIRKKNRTRNYLALGAIGLLVVAGGLYSRARYMRRSRDIISKERDRSDNLLLNILPAEIAAELKEKGRADARDFEMVSILFTDFKGFTEASAKLSAQDLVSEINTCFEAFDGIVGRHGVEKIKTIGDAYMAAGGLPVPDVNAARNTVLAGLEMQAFMKQRKAERDAQGLPAFEMRVGIHTGPVVAGIVGVKKFQYDIWGDTVNTASRMESSGEVGQVNMSEVTYALVKSDTSFAFTARGKVQAKGKGEMEMYYVTEQQAT